MSYLTKPLKAGKLKYIIVGTGRCGTVYMAKLLTSLGFPCGHESIFQNDGFEKALKRLNNKEKISVSLISKLASNEEEKRGISWFSDPEPILIADSSYMAAPFLDYPELEEVKIIHVIREPMKVINSFVEGFKYFHENIRKEDKPYHDFIYHHVPELLKPMDSVSKAALYYVRWNEMIEAKSKKENYFCHRIESDIGKLVKYLGCTGKVHYKNQKANHKENLKDKYTYIEQIEVLEIRNLLKKIRNKYYETSLL